MKTTKKISKILITIILVVILNLFNMQCVFADDPATASDIIGAGKEWIEKGKQEEGDLTVDYFAGLFVGVGQVLVIVGIVAILIVTAITAFNWITATPDKQAKLKQQLIGLVISIVVIFGAIGIWNFVRGLMGDVEEEMTANIQTNNVYIAAIQEKI